MAGGNERSNTPKQICSLNYLHISAYDRLLPPGIKGLIVKPVEQRSTLSKYFLTRCNTLHAVKKV